MKLQKCMNIRGVEQIIFNSNRSKVPHMCSYRNGHKGLSDCPGQLKVTVGHTTELLTPLARSDK